MKFSERIGANPKPPLQIDGISENLRVGIWDFMNAVIEEFNKNEKYQYEKWRSGLKRLYGYIGWPEDEAISFNGFSTYFDKSRLKQYLLKNAINAGIASR